VRRRAPTKPPFDLKVVPAEHPVDVELFLDRYVAALRAVDAAGDPLTPHQKEHPSP